MLCTWRIVYIYSTNCHISAGILKNTRVAKLNNQLSAVVRTKHIIECDKMEALTKIHTYCSQIIKEAIETVLSPSQLQF
jgi:hypothetical protein